MPTIINKELYEIAKQKADKIYNKSSAYKSAYIQKYYKSIGGKYQDDNKPKNLKRWFDEKWQDVGGKAYPVYRPTIKINKKLTPLTVNEIDKSNLLKQIKQKQLIKGNNNLSPFLKK